jgi:predicted TIM-barrel fold metal-dependent hydrolase
MKIIDAHTHIFASLQGFNGKGELRPIGGGDARWASGELVHMLPPELGESSFSAQALRRLLQENGVERAVLLQGNFYGFQNEYAAEAAAAYPEMFLAAGTYDPFGTYAGRIHDRLAGELHTRVFKFETSTGCGLMSYHPPFDIFSVFDPIAARIEGDGGVMVLDIGSPGMPSFQPQSVRRLAERHPGLKLVVCHLMAPTPADGDVLRRALETLVLPNVWFDLAAVPFNVQPEVYPYPTGAGYVRMAADIVGAERLLWGTDVPSVLCRDSYRHLLDYLEVSGLFRESELQAMLGENAAEVYPFA